MARTKPAYPPEFTAEAVRLVGSTDRSLTRIAKDLGVADHTLRNWVQHAEINDGGRDALTPSDREELRQVRREVHTLCQEGKISANARSPVVAGPHPQSVMTPRSPTGPRWGCQQSTANGAGRLRCRSRRPG
jgi:transposase